MFRTIRIAIETFIVLFGAVMLAYLAINGGFGYPPPPSPSPSTVVHTVRIPVTQLPVCKDEDSTNCIWDAQSLGNGEGDSFIQYRGHWFYAETDEMDRKMGW
jgi:hypothetical protein